MSIGTMLIDVGEILLFGLLFGAGLPAIFALGVKAWSPHPGADGTAVITTNPAGRIAGALCFAVCLAAVITGVVLIILGGRG